MQIEIELSDELFEAVTQIVKRDGTTVDSLIEQGLRVMIEEAKESVDRPYALRKCSVGGGGVTAEFIARGGWKNLREIANER